MDVGFAANGEVNLVDAHIGGQLICSGGTFTNEGGIAINGNGLTADGGVFLNAGFTAEGEVNLVGAQVGGQLDCTKSTFTNRGRIALDADSLKSDGSVLLHDGFTANGEVNLVNAHIGGQLACTMGTFTNEGRKAINANALTTGGSVLLRRRFTAIGEVDLVRTTIGGNLDCAEGTFTNPNGWAVCMESARIANDAFWYRAKVTGGLNVRSAKVNAWYDSMTAWPAKNDILLNGMAYNSIAADPPVTVRQRLEWVRRDREGFRPQPYEQLATVYRRAGQEQEARKVQISAQWRRRAVVDDWPGRALWPFRILWSAVLWATVGYGYRAWQILAPIGLLYGFGCWWFSRAAQRGFIVPAKDVDPNVKFNSARYTADLLIPGASLGERAHFIPLGDTAWWATGYTLAGWALAAMLIAGLTGVFKRQ
jgi:hypothetical protein